MEDFNQKATKEIADMMHYVAEDAVKNAPYDKTRNATITKVYYAQDLNTIIGYDIKVDGRSYHIPKESGKGIIAKENDVVKLHFPCNNASQFYLSYPHDPEDFIKHFITNEGSEYIMYYNTGRYERVIAYDIPVTFPATTKQFSSVVVNIPMALPTSLVHYSFDVVCDSGVWGVVTDSLVSSATSVNVKLYNENPTTTTPVTKTLSFYIKAMGIINN